MGVAQWWSIEVMHGGVSAFRWQEQHDSALIEAALTNGVRDGAWHADQWGVVFEVLFEGAPVHHMPSVPAGAATISLTSRPA